MSVATERHLFKVYAYDYMKQIAVVSDLEASHKPFKVLGGLDASWEFSEMRAFETLDEAMEFYYEKEEQK